jgi:hypothetical protein
MTPAEWARLLYAVIPHECGQTNVTIWNRQTKKSIHVAVPHDGSGEFDRIVAEQVQLGRDVYFGVGLRRPMLLESQRGKVADVRGLPGLWLDIDFDRLPTTGTTGARPHAATNLPKTDADACEILSVMPEPTAIIDSGFGWHVYWLFDVVHPIGYADESYVSKASRLFHERAISHAARKGFHVDRGLHTLDKVLRLPSTINTKAGGCEPVVCLLADGPRYASLDKLLEAAQVDMRTPTVEFRGQSSTAAPEDISVELCEPRPHAALEQDPTWLRDALKRLHNPDSRELLQTVLDGKPFAEPGDRDSTLQRIASVIAYLAPDRDAEELAHEILFNSLAHFDDVDQGTFTQQDRLVWAAEKIERAQVDARRDRVHRERQDKQIADVLIRQARSAPRRDQRLGPAPQGPYEQVEIEKFAAQQSTTVAEFKKHWIIQKGSSFYVYINGDYQLPLTTPELDVSLPRDLAPAVQNNFVRLDTLNAKGEPRRKTTKELLSDYASVARTLVTHLDLGHSYYDSTTQTFYEAACPIRPLEAAYNPEVDFWLRLLGGKHADKLLDWVATVSQLDKQSSALYLQGPPGTGKSLISQGLARLWHKGGPTELIRVLGDWTADLARCPLVVADEQIPQSFKGQRTSAELRALIGTSSRTLTRKYLNNSDLVGAVRMILSANNADMLVFDEMLSQSDLEAVAGRFLHIHGDKQAAVFLNTIDTSDWVDDDVIAKHALWLRDHRTVVPGRRFMVEGDAGAVSKMLATRGNVPSRVAEWLVRYICDTRQSGPTQLDLVRMGNGKYLVNTNAVVQFWDAYVKSSKVPATPQVGAALRNLATDQHRDGSSKRFWQIDVEAISAWSEANLVGDVQTIYERVNALTPEVTDDGTSSS